MSLPDRIPVSTIMTTQLVVLNTTDSLEKAERLFKKHRIRHIPVIEGQNRIVGMLSLTDLLRISFADGAYEDDDDRIAAGAPGRRRWRQRRCGA